MEGQDLQKLVTMRMPYGKHQGRLIADLPGAYLAWFARKGFPTGELGRLLALMLELDHNGLSSLLDPLRALTARTPWRYRVCCQSFLLARRCIPCPTSSISRRRHLRRRAGA